jgi:predicted HAD superfamily phosphohydrolase YqeG
MRVPRIRVSDLDQATRVHADAKAWLVDLENTLTGFDPSPREVEVSIQRFCRSLRSDASVVVVTNSRIEDSEFVSIVGAAHKPFTRSSRLGVRDLNTCVVLGDQPITDGLLAWRLRCPYIECRKSTREPIWPALLRVLGWAIAPLAFRTRDVRLGSRTGAS